MQFTPTLPVLAVYTTMQCNATAKNRLDWRCDRMTERQNDGDQNRFLNLPRATPSSLKGKISTRA